MSVQNHPADGQPLPVDLKLRQHEVQVVSGPGGCLAAAWTDDTKMKGADGWTCGYSVSLDRGRSWTAPLFHKHSDFDATANPTIAVDPRGVVFAISMSLKHDYTTGILEMWFLPMPVGRGQHGRRSRRNTTGFLIAPGL